MKKLMFAVIVGGLGIVPSEANVNPGPPNLQASSFDASGPVAVTANQTAMVCATNEGGSQVHVLIALLNANTAPNPNNVPVNQILAVREAALDPGHGVCLAKTGAELNTAAKTNPQLPVPWDNNILAVVLEGGIFSGATDGSGGVVEQGIIIQGGIHAIHPRRDSAIASGHERRGHSGLSEHGSTNR